VGATITSGMPKNPLIIGDRVVIGAGACVVGDIPPDQTVVGIPARSIEDGRREEWTVLRGPANCSAG
jgi:acetyltransferase-like isoleucine patch superfamily enzyme